MTVIYLYMDRNTFVVNSSIGTLHNSDLDIFYIDHLHQLMEEFDQVGLVESFPLEALVSRYRPEVMDINEESYEVRYPDLLRIVSSIQLSHWSIDLGLPNSSLLIGQLLLHHLRLLLFKHSIFCSKTSSILDG